MKQFIVDRHTTPNTPTLEQVPTEKIPIYENRAAVTADLANLSEGQIVATTDTGDELAQPVDVVESGNLHAVTSDAVAEAFNISTDNGWHIYKIGKKYIGLYSRSEGASTPITTSYGNMYLSAVKSLALPQNVKNIQKVAGSVSQTGGGVLYVSMNDIRADINIKTDIQYYYASPYSYTASNCGALFYCFGDYE